MKNEYDPNPFDDEEQPSPFPKNAAAGFNFRFPSVASGPVGFGRQHDDAAIDIPLDTDSIKNGRDFGAWEVELTRRETDREISEVVNKVGESNNEKNWPPFFPIIHHDIANDIPLLHQRVQRMAFASWLGIILCLFWNLLAVTLCWIKGFNGGGGGVLMFILAIIYVIAGCPLSYLLWYRPLYRAIRTDSALKCTWLWALFVHHLFCYVAMITPPIYGPLIVLAMSLTGIFSAIWVFLENYYMVGVFYIIGFGLFTLEVILSSVVLMEGLIQIKRRQVEQIRSRQVAEAQR